MKIFNQMAFVWLLGVLALVAAGCEKQSTAGVTGAALTTNKVDDDQDNKVDEADEAQCTCNNVGSDDDKRGDGSVGDKDNDTDESAKADGGARHHECECGGGDHHHGGGGSGDHDGDHETDEGAGGSGHTQVNLGAGGSVGK